MRQTLLGLTLALGTAAAASAQSSSLTALEQEAQRLAQSTWRVVVSNGALSTEMPAATAPYVTGGPLATVPARAFRAGVEPTVQEFRIRAWTEGGSGVRVLVFAVTREVREEQIASVLVPLGPSVEIAATEKFNARRITLRVINSNSMGRPVVRRVPTPPAIYNIYSIKTYRGDVPTDPMRRPWQPPARR